MVQVRKEYVVWIRESESINIFRYEMDASEYWARGKVASSSWLSVINLLISDNPGSRY